MTAWRLLPLALALGCAGAALSYSDARKAGWYVPAMAALGAACSAAFALGARWCDRPADLYVFSLAFDAALLAAWYLLPLAVLGARVPGGVALGAALVAAGLLIVHASGD